MLVSTVTSYSEIVLLVLNKQYYKLSTYINLMMDVFDKNDN